jgi:hypothetical protein
VSQTRGQIPELIDRYTASINRLQRVIACSLGIALSAAGLSTVVEGTARFLRAISAVSVLITLGALFLVGIQRWARARFIRMR